MTALLVDRGAFAKDPLVVVDVGARGGVEDHWSVFGDHIRVLGFEADADECARLNSTRGRRIRYLPYALGREKGTRKLHIMNHSPSTSFYRPDQTYHARYLDGANLVPLREVDVQTTTLTSALAEHQIPTPDFIKIDVEGAELEVLQGADELMRSPDMLGLVSEVRFTSKSSGCPLFWQMEKYAREVGLELYDLDTYRHSKRALPYPYLYDFHDPQGEAVAGPSTQGQILWGDALYMRDKIGQPSLDLPPRKLRALACLFELFGLNDCAAELIVANKEHFASLASVSMLLDLLVPQVKDRQLSYADYMNRDVVKDDLLRPTSGKRFPEPIVVDYDGEFRPAWSKKWFR